MQAELKSLIERSDAIPSAPQLVTRLLEITNDPNFKQPELVKLLSSDAGIATDMLRLANSALFSGGRKVATLSEAITRLGTRRIRTLVIGRSMVDQLNTKGSKLLDASYYWRRSLGAAVLAARFADLNSELQRELSFMGGLLCDLGVPVLARAMPQKYAPAAAAYGPLHGEHLLEKELACVGVTHPEVSAMALERWSLPTALVAAVRHHHAEPIPDDLPESAAALAAVIGASSEIARFLCESPNKQQIRAACIWATARVGIDLSALGEVLKLVESDINELAACLRVDVVPSRIYAIIAESIREAISEPVGA
ncbi:MAG: HDOD domain-containing protein [Phycisphaerae bacterium]